MTNKIKTELEALNEINTKLDKIIGILATSSIKDPKDKIPLLKKMGITIEDTVMITGLTINIVKKGYAKLKEPKK